MGTSAQKLQKIRDSKEAIRLAIEAKGVTIPANTKLVNTNWDKRDSLWYLTREMRPDEDAETYTYQEDSTFGVLTGKVTLVEHKR